MLQTQRFETIYDLVTSALTEFVRIGVQRGELSPVDVKWFNDLIDGFHVEYRKWPSYASGHIAEYLKIFERSGVHRDVRLAGHVFLHVGYDLPRVIAASLASTSLRMRGRQIFPRPGPLLLRVFLKYARRGYFGVGGQMFGRVEAIRILGYWVIALRSIAWIHAEALADASSSAHMEARMAAGMRAAALEATSHWWITGIPDLDNSELLSVVPMGLGSMLRADVAIAIALASAIGATVFTSILTRRRSAHRVSAAATVDVLGALVARNLARAMNPDTLLPPSSVEAGSQELP